MTLAFIIAFIVGGIFYFLWQDTKEKLEEAERQIRQLKRQKKNSTKSNTRKKTGFATIEMPAAKKEYAIRQPEPKPVEPLLDLKKLAELKEETRAAQSMLAEIFVQEEPAPVQKEMSSDKDLVLRVLESLFDKEVWTRSEIAQLAGPDVMIGNLLEKINDYACSRIDDIVLEEDGDKIYVTTEYKEQLI